MKILSLSLIAVSLCVSCQKDGKPSEKISAKASDSAAAVAAAAYEANLRSMAAPAQNMQTPTAVNPTNSSTTATTVVATKPGMNPPHGQPGHRCDIAVGAPLNSKPTAPNNSPTAKITPSAVTPQAVTANNNTPALLQPNTEAPKAAPQKTLEGMQGKPNPAHGQEGHRCDVTVGAPLP